MHGPSPSRWTPRRIDTAVTAAAVTIGFADSWVKPYSGLLTGLPTPVIALVSAAVATALWWRRRWPGAVTGVVMAAYGVGFTPVTLGIALFTVRGGYRRRLPALAGFAVAGFAAGLIGLRGGLPEAGVREAAYSLAMIIGPLMVGYAVGVRRDLVAAAEEHLADLRRQQELLAERARADERAGIAREMHDVVGHRVSNIVLAAGALQVGPAADRPEITRTVERIRRDGRQALEELREILDVLDPAGRERPGSLEQSDADLRTLVEGARAHGQAAELAVNGHPELLPYPMRRALQRVVQESLTNAAKHAPGAPVRVEVDCRRDGVALRVLNTAPTRPASPELPSGGRGLPGLAERVGLLGGTLVTGPYDGGYVVEAFIPHHRPPTAHDTSGTP
ncbi:sensor histidine kinase [Streptomyces sp. N35]|uniref:sensor histidine kinase n=1 Tax=Streptomyces sp. N35 TaxID=2795730 RepID=UPI0018F68360|nr:histidine kinase [Streptomyces sp. N35]